MKRYTNKLWGALLPLLMTGCNADTAWNGTDVAQGTAIRLLVQSSSGASSEQEELQLNDIRAYRFADGTLQEVFGPMTPGKDGLCYLPLGTGNGTLYVLNGEAGTTVRIDGQTDGVTIQTASVRSLQPVAAVTVTAEQRLPGSVWEYIHLDLYREQTLTGRVVLALEPHPEDAAATGTSGF